MAKVVPGPLTRRAMQTVRGVVYIRDTRWGPIVQKWPKKRDKATAGYDLYRQGEFGIAARWAVQPVDLDYGTAVEMAKGTEQVPRDILMMAMQGLYYIPIGPDGREIRSTRMDNPNPQYILDMVGDTPGSMLIRTDIGWVLLTPGSDGDVVTMNGGTPSWLPTGGSGGGGAPVWCPPISVASSGSFLGARTALITPANEFKFSAGMIRISATTSGLYGLRIFEQNTNKLGALIADGGQIAPTFSGIQDLVWTFSPHVTIAAGQSFYAVLYNYNGSGSYQLNAFDTGNGWFSFPQTKAWAGGYIATNNPVAGQTVGSNSNGTGVAFKREP